MAKNTYKQQHNEAPSRANEPRPTEARTPRIPSRPSAAEPVRETRRNEPKGSATPKAPRQPMKLPSIKLGGVFGFLRDRRFQLFLGFFFLLSSIYLTIAFLSFIFTGHADQSVV